MSNRNKFLGGITTLDKSAFSFSTGLRSAIFVMLPLVIGFAAGFPEAVFIGIGALFLTNTEGPRSTLLSRILLAACFTEASAWALGTLAGMTGLLAPILIGLGVFIASLARVNLNWAPVAMFTAISFAVGAGLPGGSVLAAEQRSSLALFGSLFALGGVALHRSNTSRKKSKSTTDPASPKSPFSPKMPRSEIFWNAAALGIASALGFGIALALGLPRDFWVVVTILLTFRPILSLTVSFTAMMVVGTILGSAIGAVVVLEITNLGVLLLLLFILSLLMFATRGVNLGVVQVFFGAFIIVFLNIIFPAGLEFAEARILDVALGGIISIATVYLVGIRERIHRRT